ncbi:hypothetical protein Tco_0291659 [Tanacetum coccineum]
MHGNSLRSHISEQYSWTNANLCGEAAQTRKISSSNGQQSVLELGLDAQMNGGKGGECAEWSYAPSNALPCRDW